MCAADTGIPQTARHFPWFEVIRCALLTPEYLNPRVGQPTDAAVILPLARALSSRA